MRYARCVLENGTIVDGSGGPGYSGSIAVDGGRIVALAEVDARFERIDVAGAVIAPGFIDIHSHADFLLPLDDQDERLRPFAEQGITTLVTGNCGYAPAPVEPGTASLLQAYTRFIKPRDLDFTWRSFGEFLETIATRGVALNIAQLAAHGAFRIAVMGFEARAADAGELEHMRSALIEALDAGAFGLSCGLIYAPGMFASTDELVALAKEVGRAGGIVTAHVRGSSETLLQAAREVVDIGRRAGVRVQHSHLEAFGARFWPDLAHVLDMHDTVRPSLDHGFDVIPYTAANTTLLAILPPFALAGGVDALLGRLQDRSERARIGRAIDTVVPEWPTWEAGRWPHNLVAAGGWDQIVVSSVGGAGQKWCEGLTLAAIAREVDRPPFEAAADLIVAARGQVTALYLGISGTERDDTPLRQALAHPSAAIETDAFSLGRGKPHPALLGSFPRVLGKYVRDEGLMALEEAVRRMTSLPAERLGLRERGMLREGYAADITVFDPATIGSTATFAEPERRPTGIRWVFVNGVCVVRDGGATAVERAGEVLRR